MVSCTQTLLFATCEHAYDMFRQVACKCEYRLPNPNALLHPHPVSCGADAYRQPALLQKDWGSSPRTGQSPAQLVRCAVQLFNLNDPSMSQLWWCNPLNQSAQEHGVVSERQVRSVLHKRSPYCKMYYCLSRPGTCSRVTPVASMLETLVCMFAAMTWLYASAGAFTAITSSKFCMREAL